MTKRANISISFTPEQAAFLASCVDCGRYRQSISEAVREGIRLLEHQHKIRVGELERIRKQIADGVADLEAGRMVDADTFFAEWDGQLNDHASTHTL